MLPLLHMEISISPNYISQLISREEFIAMSYLLFGS